MVTLKSKKVVVIGVGNLLLKDEGIGVHVAHAMNGITSTGNMELEVVDGGTLPEAAIFCEGVDKLIVVDAVQAGGEPGAVYRFHHEDIEMDDRVFTSLHQLSLLDNLWLMEKFGQKPGEVVIIGVEPEDIDCGLELSATLQKRIPQIIDVIMNEVHSGQQTKPEKGARKI